jgi:hypothetical protein
MTTLHIGPREYSIIQRSRWFVLNYWCDCVFGPHWHQLATYGRKSEAITAAETHAAEGSR